MLQGRLSVSKVISLGAYEWTEHLNLFLLW